MRALAGEYRWKMRRTPVGVVSTDGELDKMNRPFADLGDALGYMLMNSGVHANLIDMARKRPGMMKYPLCTYCNQQIRNGECGCTRKQWLAS